MSSIRLAGVRQRKSVAGDRSGSGDGNEAAWTILLLMQQQRALGGASARVTLALLVLALVFAGWSFLLGPSELSPRALFTGLFDGHGAAGIIAQQIRLPRAALALVIGAALGGSGAALQGLFCNPLA